MYAGEVCLQTLNETMIVLIKTLQVILALSVLILFHELGHFTFAKLFKIRVDKFYLFFDVGGKALFKFKPKNSETEYGIGWLPLGGYCKIAGMVDESMDTEYLKSEPKPWELRSHPAWQRLLVMAGGVLFNFILAIIIYIGVLAGWGQSYVSNDGSDIYVNELAYEMGFRTGDHIIAYDGVPEENFGLLQADLARNDVRMVTLLRDGDTLSLYVDQSRIGDVLNTPGMFDLALPFVIDSIPPASPNFGMGLERGDRVVAIDGKSVPYLQDSRVMLRDYAGSSVTAQVLRGEDTLSLDVAVDTLGRIGVFTTMPNIQTKKYGFFEAIPAGFSYTFTTIGDYLKDMKLVFTPSTEAYKSVGSFIAIGQVFPSAWNWYAFLNILALLSVMLGVMNLLPIPALDGGHIAFILYEMVTGRKPSDKFLIVMQIVGMIIIFALMILAFGNDIMRLLR